MRTRQFKVPRQGGVDLTSPQTCFHLCTAFVHWVYKSLFLFFILFFFIFLQYHPPSPKENKGIWWQLCFLYIRFVCHRFTLYFYGKVIIALELQGNFLWGLLLIISSKFWLSNTCRNSSSCLFTLKHHNLSHIHRSEKCNLVMVIYIINCFEAINNLSKPH